MIFQFILFIIITFSANAAESKEHYKIEEINDSEYIGEVYNIEKPIVYIKNISKCNDLTKEILACGKSLFGFGQL